MADTGRVGLIAYHAGVKISRADPPFYALLVALMLRADSYNAERLRLAFPDDWDEVQRRYDAPGGVLYVTEEALYESMVSGELAS